MKYSKKRNQWEASNVSFNADSIAAYSYAWWQFVKVIKGKVVFNNYHYSNSTSKHQSKVRSLMRELDIEIDRVVSFRKGLNDITTLRELSQVQKDQDKIDTERAEAKRLARNAKARRKNEVKRLITSIFENELHFRDYQFTREYVDNSVRLRVSHHISNELLKNEVVEAMKRFQDNGAGSITVEIR